MKTGPDALGTAENDPGAQNLKTGSDALGTAKNESRRLKHEKRDPTPTVPPKMSLGAQNIIMGPESVRTAENESGCAKHENGTRRPQYRQKRVRARKT
jgi:hypothetical protein